MQQIAGPYAVRIDTHRFRDVGLDKTEIEDEVVWPPPFAPMGELAGALGAATSAGSFATPRGTGSGRTLAQPPARAGCSGGWRAGGRGHVSHRRRAPGAEMPRTSGYQHSVASTCSGCWTTRGAIRVKLRSAAPDSFAVIRSSPGRPDALEQLPQLPPGALANDPGPVSSTDRSRVNVITQEFRTPRMVQRGIVAGVVGNTS